MITEKDIDQHKTYCTFSQAKYEENVINFILESLVPINIVELAAFRKIFDGKSVKN